MRTFSIYHDLSIQAPIQTVFEAVAQPGHLVNWWPLKCTGEPKVGGEYNYYFTSEYDWWAKVIHC